MRSGVDIFDDRVFLGRIEILGSDDDAPNVGLGIPSLGDEYLGGFETRSNEFGDVAPLHFSQQRAVGSAVQLGDIGHVDA
jgi:hypothetical protein